MWDNFRFWYHNSFHSGWATEWAVKEGGNLKWLRRRKCNCERYDKTYLRSAYIDYRFSDVA